MRELCVLGGSLRDGVEGVGCVGCVLLDRMSGFYKERWAPTGKCCLGVSQNRRTV